MTKAEFPLPSYAHLPGRNDRHPEGFADSIIKTIPDLVRSEDCEQLPALDHALLLIEKEYYWEAHEVLEAIWIRTPRNSREFHLLKGIIHVANGGLKARMDRPAAVSRLKELADESFHRSYQNASVATVLGITLSDVNRMKKHHLG